MILRTDVTVHTILFKRCSQSFKQQIQSETNLTVLLLQLLIGIVDTELFETICFKTFKPVDIQDANVARRGICTGKLLINTIYDGCKLPLIYMLSQSVPRKNGLWRPHWLLKHFASPHNMSICQPFRQSFFFHMKQVAHNLEMSVIFLQVISFGWNKSFLDNIAENEGRDVHIRKGTDNSYSYPDPRYLHKFSFFS